MTDMRATARLLEAMQEKLIDVRDFDNPDFDFRGLVSDLLVMLDELRRRGDTLVRGHDLEVVVQALHRGRLALGEDDAKALDRLDGALGGVL
jgi:hypothetical protein